MANLVVTSTANSIKVDFNDQPFIDARDGMTYLNGTWNKSSIANIKLKSTNDCVIVMERDGFEWNLSSNGTEDTLTIDLVDGIAPVSNSDLYDKLIALIA